jgi:eukaryotic-like serine/threonine-protein kinase
MFPMDLQVGQMFGEYEITALLDGARRMYKVEHRLTKRTEAMKVLSAELASETQTKRFNREMRALARLSHPNIAVLHNALHWENQLILLMEFVDGQTLESLLSAGHLPLDIGVAYIKQILLALRYAHERGIVHRDITPANVLITTTGEVKMSDFGLSKAFGDSLLTNCGEILGALPYLAPEQVKGTTQPDLRSDLFSVGAILYEILTGQKPYGANRKLAPVLTDSESDPEPPSRVQPTISQQWDELIRRALARDPRHRFQSAEEFLNAIAQVDQPAIETELSLPHIGPVGIGLVIVAGLALAMVASPAIKLFRPEPSAIISLHPLHISPPSFATSPTASIQQATPATTPQLVKPAGAQHSKRAAEPAEASVTEPPQPAQTSSPDPTPTTPKTTIPTASVKQDVNEALPSEPAEADAPEVTIQKKKTFWNKLNVFKKKSPDQQQQ